MPVTHICHRQEIQDKEKMIWFRCSESNWDFNSNASGCIDELWHFLCAQWFSCWESKADNWDIIKWCHSDLSCYWGREVYKEEQAWARGCCLGFWHWMVGSIDMSLTLYSGYIGASCGARVQPGRTVYLVYSCACTQTHFGELFSWYDFSCLAVSQVGHYLHPLEPCIEEIMDHNLS